MGAGIAQVSAQAGMKVTMIDTNQEALDRAMDTIGNSVTRIVRKKFPSDEAKAVKFKNMILDNISTTTIPSEGVASADLVVEAVTENLTVKHKIFAELDKAAPKHCIFATNTSSLGVKDIAEPVSDERKALFGGVHFFNPVPMMKLVEVVQAEGMTTDATYKALEDYCHRLQKVTVKCKDTPGFVLNRLGIAYSQEAIKLYERGDASIVDIDTAMKLGAGYPMGPFELLDYVGLDIHVFVQEIMLERTGLEVFEPTKIISKLVAEGHLGKKTGKGFYSYETGKRVARDDL